MTTINSSQTGERDAQLFAWLLLIEDMSNSTFAALPIPEQVALAENVGLDVEGLMRAMRYMSAYHIKRATALREYKQSRTG